MTTFVLSRLSQLVVVLLGTTVITFGILYLIPADPARAIAGPRASGEVVARIRVELGLDQPVYVQYLRYLSRLLQGDLGRSPNAPLSVGEAIVSRLPATLQLALAGILARLLLGLPLGIVAALWHGRWADKLALVLSLLGVCAPPFWLGLLLLYYFAYRLGLFPLGGYGSLAHLALPALTLGLIGAPWYARMLRSSMLDILNADYVRTARAKGLRERTVVLGHVLRNALGPVVTMFGMDLGQFFGGVVVVEAVFGWPGLGTLVLEAIEQFDIPMIMGTVLLMTVAVAIGSMIVDVVQAMLDPRVRLR